MKMKKFSFLLSAILLWQNAEFLPALPAKAEEKQQYIYADFDGDQKLTIFDLCLMKKALKNPDSMTEIQKIICDTSADGAFTVQDVQLLQDYLLARIQHFPSGGIYTPVNAYNGQKKLSGTRQFEKLDRGTYAVNAGNSVFISWRLMAQDEPDIGFNVYRTTDGVTVKLNAEPLKGGTNYTDTSADLSKDNTYYVTTIYNNVETPTDGDFTLKAGESVGGVKGNAGAAQIIPIHEGGTIHFVWVGDFNQDGKYDFLVDRCDDDHQKLEAYLHDGTYLWTIDMGYNSEYKYQIEPGASTIDVGMWDGATVYDIDMDGSAEVMVRIADGVTFGDGTVYTNKTHDNAQVIAVIDGMTGKLKASQPVPNDWLDEGPMACMMEIGYLDGQTPSLICWLKNRNDDKSFNSIHVAYGYGNGTEFVQQWKSGCYGAEAHQFRVEDVDFDGKDEILHIGYALNSDGSLRYTMPDVIHGDRYHIAPFCNANNKTEMLGYGVQQRNPSTLLEYIYNASTGKLLWTNYGGDGDVDIGRGDIGDVDPTHEGYEVWSFQGMYDMNGTKISDTTAYPSLKLYWDGDLFTESYNDSKIEKWNYNTQTVERLATTWKITGCASSERGAPMFYGDILGDWREEIICTGYNYDSLVILSTTIPTDYRLNTLSQDPAYRNDMTSKGYVQSNMLSYYLGEGMDTPPIPDISYIGESALEDGATYRIRNLNSGKYMEVKSGTAESGTNVHQWGNNSMARNRWRLVDKGDGYYSLVSAVGNGNAFALDVTGQKANNGTNIEIYDYTGGQAQQFKIIKQGAGYLIKTKVSGDKSCVEIANAETGNGANVQEWEINGASCQLWAFEKVE